MRPNASRVASRYLVGRRAPPWRGRRLLRWLPSEEDEFSGEPPGGTEDILTARNREGEWRIGRVLHDGRYIVAHTTVNMDVPLALTPSGWMWEDRPTRGTYATLEEAKQAAATASPVEFNDEGYPILVR